MKNHTLNGYPESDYVLGYTKKGNHLSTRFADGLVLEKELSEEEMTLKTKELDDTLSYQAKKAVNERKPEVYKSIVSNVLLLALCILNISLASAAGFAENYITAKILMNFGLYGFSAMFATRLVSNIIETKEIDKIEYILDNPINGDKELGIDYNSMNLSERASVELGEKKETQSIVNLSNVEKFTKADLIILKNSIIREKNFFGSEEDKTDFRLPALDKAKIREKKHEKKRNMLNS